MEAHHIPLIIEKLDKTVTEDRLRKYSNSIIIKIIVILKLYGISYRSSKSFFNNHPELFDILKIHNIPNFRTLSYRALRIDWHYINSQIIDMINTQNENAAIDSFIVRTCKDST